MTTESLPIEERFVLFADLLGSSEASKRDDFKKQRSILELLQAIQSQVSEESVTFTLSEDRRGHSGRLGEIRIFPEFSAFSDNFIASYRIPGDQYGFGKNFCLDLFLQEAQRIIGMVSFQASNLGLLIRGGITIGNLHHESGVVFGKGLVEAYELESKVAIYPRIVVGPKIYQEASSDMKSKLCQDEDGIWHLNYFRAMSEHALKLNTENSNDRSVEWYQATQRMLNENINSLERDGKLKEMQKWFWFKDKFETIIGSDWHFISSGSRGGG